MYNILLFSGFSTMDRCYALHINLHFLLTVTELDPAFVFRTTKFESINLIRGENGEIFRYHMEDNTVALCFIRMSPTSGGSGELGDHSPPPQCSVEEWTSPL